jgi:DNA polymerase I
MYKIDYPTPGTVVTWSLDPDGGVERTEREFYPTLYVGAPDHSLDGAVVILEDHPLVEDLSRTRRRPGWRHGHADLLEVSASSLEAVDELARTIAQQGRPGQYRLYNVDLSREFRYCLETGTDPTPARDPTVCRLSAPEMTYSDDGQLQEVTVDDEVVTGPPAEVASAVAQFVADCDPDVVRIDRSDLIPTLFDAAETDTYQLGRDPGYQTLATKSTFESYGRVGHSPARYNLPGRAIVDESNAFWIGEGGLEGMLDLVERSWKPLQETAWASIGNVLTAIQVKYAREHDVLVPWRSWRHERFKTARTLDAADRGGFTFAPDVGVHEDVHELDFSSLYPNIIRTRNISPETVRCDCHPDHEDVPGLDYAICPEDGYLPDVLGPIIDDRDEIKQAICESDDPDEIDALEGRSDALKWILVSCFGYQGFANAKFGRIECHESINAYAREILLDAKETFEANGWRVVHGIVDSLWVQAIDDQEQTPLGDVASEISEATGIRLEYEQAYDWIAFCPRRNDAAGALTKYFGHIEDEPVDDPGSYKVRGIEIRQRSTPPFFETVQLELMQTLAATHDPEKVCDRLQVAIGQLRAGAVDPASLAIKNRVSKSVEEYTQATRNVAALQRSQDLGLEKRPGQDVEYVVVDDSVSSRERVVLLSEEPDVYDATFYCGELVRIAESILSPLGWKSEKIEEYLADRQDATISAF